MKGVILVAVILFATCHSSLILPSHVKNLHFEKLGDDVKSVKTSCNKVDISKFKAVLPATQLVFAGYLNVADNSDSGLAFIFYGSQKAKSLEDISQIPTVIWLNGGPGSSSQLGNFLELGPIHIDAQGNQFVNQFSWDTEYNVMFVDQPIGAGFSVFANSTEIPIDQDKVGQHFAYALNQFLFGDLGCVKAQKIVGLDKSPWFLFGESYAGKYVPAIAQAIISDKNNKIPLKGVGIGDGFTDPLTIMKEMPNFGFSMGLIDYQERQLDEKYALTGSLQIKQEKWLEAQKSFDRTCDQIVTKSGGVNVYNIFVFGTYDDTQNKVRDYLNDADTKTIFGFNPAYDFSMSSGDVYQALSPDFMKRDCLARVEYILKQGLQVLIYNGQNDLIVPNPGTLKWVYNLDYSKSNGFQNKDFELWQLQDKTVGYKKSAGNLELRIVNKAGHLVPMDQPEAALDLVKSFVEAHKK